MPASDFVCLDCGEPFTIDAPDAPEGERARCPRCGSDHVRQTVESYLRNALAVRRDSDLDELRSCHFG